MLERVALRLESGGRQLLRGRLKKRMLHSSFWTHGAGELEFAAASLLGWERGTGGLEEIGSRAHESQRRPPLMDVMQLEFLYPSKTMAFLRHLAIPQRNRQKLLPKRTAFSQGCKRLFSSSSDGPDDTDAKSTVPLTENQTEAQSPRPEYFANLQSIIASGEKGKYDAVWINYQIEKRKGGDEDSRRNKRSWVVAYLAESTRRLEKERIVIILSEIPFKERLPYEYRRIVRSLLDLGLPQGALSVLKDSVEHHASSLNVGFELFISSCIENDSWDMVLEAWRTLESCSPSRCDQLDLKFVAECTPGFKEKVMVWIAGIPEDFPAGMFVLGLLRGALRAATRPDVEKAFDYEEIWNAIEERGGKLTNREYEYILYHLYRFREWTRATELYHKYRELPSVKPRPGILNGALRAFRGVLDFRGMQIVFDDWFAFGLQPGKQAYYLLMAEMARHGEASAVKELLDQFYERFPGVDHLRPFTNVMHAHAKRGELEETIKWFNKISQLGFMPDAVCYNILINAYSKANDVDAALRRADEMVEKGLEPDIFTYTTLMSMSANRGDVENTERFFETAKNTAKIRPNALMYSALVQAYVESDQMEKAEDTVFTMENSGIDEPKTHIWNTLLSGYASMRDPQKLNGAYSRMQRAGVPFDDYTYGVLMHSLCLIGNVDAAEKVLLALEKEGIKENPVHYAVIMVGHMRNKDISKVWSTFNAMNDRNIRPSFITQAVLLQASAFADHAEYRTSGGTLWLESAEEILAQVTSKLDVLDPLSNDNVKSATPPWLFTPLISIYGKEGSYQRSKDLFRRFLEISEAQRPGGTTPSVKMYVAIMVAHMRARNTEGVRIVWDFLKDYNDKLVQSAHNRRERRHVLRSRRNSLCTPFSVFIQTMSQDSNLQAIGDELRFMVTKGYELDNNNWNNYVQAFVLAGELIHATVACEKYLMPGWTARKSFYSERRVDTTPFPKFYPFIRTIEAIATDLKGLQMKMVAGDIEAKRVIDEVKLQSPNVFETCDKMPRLEDRMRKELGYRHWKRRKMIN